MAPVIDSVDLEDGVLTVVAHDDAPTTLHVEVSVLGSTVTADLTPPLEYAATSSDPAVTVERTDVPGVFTVRRV